MSRGFGRVEREIISLLGHFNAPGPELALWAAGKRNSPSVRRALKRLHTKGVIAPLSNRHGRSTVWGLTETARAEAKRKRRRDRDGTRRAEEGRRERREREEAQRAARRRFDRGRSTAKLERLLGMLGSSHGGEVANAALAVERSAGVSAKLGRSLWPSRRSSGRTSDGQSHPP